MNRVKRMAIGLLVIVYVFSAAAGYAEDVFSTQGIEEKPNLYVIHPDESRGIAFVRSALDVSYLAFSHPDESKTLYSYIRSDILVSDYHGSNPFPVVRTWIYYSSGKLQNIESVTFELEGKSYTLTDLKGNNGVTESEDGYTEQLVIKYGTNNGDFLSAILSKSLAYMMRGDENEKPPEMKMILHGQEDVETTVPGGFWTDFAVIVSEFVFHDAWAKYLWQIEGTPCRTAEIAAGI